MPREKNKEKCTELQLIFHIAIAFGLGTLIGGALVAQTTHLESDLLAQSTDLRRDFAASSTALKENLAGFLAKHDEFYARAVFGVQSLCTDLTNYFIDGSQGAMRVEFVEPFRKKPALFLSINGFLYYPLIVKKDDVREQLTFQVGDLDERGFSLSIESSEPQDFSKNNFDRIDICYLAFLNA